MLTVILLEKMIILNSQTLTNPLTFLQTISFNPNLTTVPSRASPLPRPSW